MRRFAAIKTKVAPTWQARAYIAIADVPMLLENSRK
jgi:hypothetical protein